jgi:triacylglycerol lipase
VHLVYLDGWGSVESNAQSVKRQLLQVLAQSGAEQVNIITHSKGGLDVRYCLGSLDCARHVASLTTIASPHNGSKTLDWLMRWFGLALRAFAPLMNCFMRSLGDGNSDFYGGCRQLTTASMQEFNQQHPVPKGVYCQSYATAMKQARDDLAMMLSYLVIRKIEGTNDGLVTPAGAAFGDYKGVLQASETRGISHCEAIDGRRKPFTPSQTPARSATSATSNITDITDWYITLVSDLKQRGY